MLTPHPPALWESNYSSKGLKVHCRSFLRYRIDLDFSTFYKCSLAWNSLQTQKEQLHILRVRFSEQFSDFHERNFWAVIFDIFERSFLTFLSGRFRNFREVIYDILSSHFWHVLSPNHSGFVRNTLYHFYSLNHILFLNEMIYHIGYFTLTKWFIYLLTQKIFTINGSMISIHRKSVRIFC